MKKIIAASMAAVWVLPVLASDLELEARQHMAGFAKNLKGALQQGMQSDGVEGAIAACNEQAPEIAEAASADGWTVGRTSLKLRNSDNAPDDWELSVLQSFEARLAKGEPMAKLQASRTDKGTYRFMKAIPTGSLCLSCHGANISDAVAARLDQLYPQDQARGYAEGDIRGAFTLSKEL
ncbi:Tll0287-like domain-containing protein [Candidatus Pelagadaptatus aseana]|uniref:Tll0287-like domain-containing protein n=1 Tax=Candidatus Pelagadaptatus aseana TaxID=3120508 RepID=UPI003C7024DD